MFFIIQSGRELVCSQADRSKKSRSYLRNIKKGFGVIKPFLSTLVEDSLFREKLLNKI